MAAPSKQNGNRRDPNASLPNNVNAINVKEFTRMVNEADEQAEGLAKKANQIYRKLHPEDKLKTDIYEKSDFLDHGYVKIPPEVQAMFDEAARLMDEKAGKTARKEPEEAPSAQEDEPEMTVEELQRQFGAKPEAVGATEKVDPMKVTRHPVLDKLKKAFGVRSDDVATVDKDIQGTKFTFEFPTAMSSSFALSLATGEGVGQMDFAYNYELAQLAMAIVAIEDVPVCKLFEVSDEYDVHGMPPKVRKICGVKMMLLLESMGEQGLSRIMDYWNSEVKPVKDGEEDGGIIVALECPKCHRTRVVTSDKDGNVPVKYCEHCGSKMEAASTSKTDADAPLA